MELPPPAVRILPMSTDDDEFRGKTISQVQRDFFLGSLMHEREGRYHYRERGLNETTGAIVLFQFDRHIVAQAEFVRSDTEPTSDPRYKGSLHFDINSIRLFEPALTLDVLREFWPELERFSNSRTMLDPANYAEFYTRYFDGVPVVTEPDVDATLPARVQVVGTRIVRDTACALYVKRLHDYHCQICGQYIKLCGGKRYAEAHHVQPLGEGGPDNETNLVCVCPNHHVQCDRAAIRLDVVTLRRAPGHELNVKYLDYHNNSRFCG